MSDNRGTDIIALVNGSPIPLSRLHRLAQGLNEERRASGRPLLQRSEILDRLVEEELLVNRAVELGLPYSDKIARGYLVNSLLILITDEAINSAPSQKALKKFFHENPQLFSPATKVATQIIFIEEESEEGRKKAETIRQRWEHLPRGRIEVQDQPPLHVPESLVPIIKLADYLGDETASEIARLAIGETSVPAPWMGGWVVARLMNRTGGQPPPFEDVSPRVLEAFRRQEAEEEYQRYMENIRAMADIKIMAGEK